MVSPAQAVTALVKNFPKHMVSSMQQILPIVWNTLTESAALYPSGLGWPAVAARQVPALVLACFPGAHPPCRACVKQIVLLYSPSYLREDRGQLHGGGGRPCGLGWCVVGLLQEKQPRRLAPQQVLGSGFPSLCWVGAGRGPESHGHGPGRGHGAPRPASPAALAFCLSGLGPGG